MREFFNEHFKPAGIIDNPSHPLFHVGQRKPLEDYREILGILPILKGLVLPPVVQQPVLETAHIFLVLLSEANTWMDPSFEGMTSQDRNSEAVNR